ncbi:MAG: HAD-IIIC family phosphatase [candidate division WOR-3 bacterium]
MIKHIEKKRRTFFELIKAQNYTDAINVLFSLIDEEPSLNNYNFAFERLKEIDLSKLGFHQIKIAILSSFTIDPIIPYLYIKCCKAKLNPNFYVGGYNLFNQEILDKNSKLYEFDPDVLILAIRLQELSPYLYESFLESSINKIEDEKNRVCDLIKSLILAFRKNSSATIIIHNFEIPMRPTLGIIDSRNEPSQKKIIREINCVLDDLAKEIRGTYILDYDNLTALRGKLKWQDDKMWFLARTPIAISNYAYLADEYIRFLKPLKGLNRKCLVLDLDNTLWGGILGEDGIDGIKLGSTYPGNAFVAFQKEILNLYYKGIILAINSKNNEADVMEVFEKHPDMVLKTKHFASWRVNWQDKVQNMKEIAEELNIGLDSIVFIDDSPFEREMMKTKLPEVLTIDMPSDPVQYCSVLREIPDFEILSFSDEDRKRGEMYHSQLERKKLQESSNSLEDFYKSLDMKIIINLADKYSIPRISQLTQKTNQFNLTTKRYSETDIQNFSESPNYRVFYIRLFDKFGDNGIVGVSILKKNSQIEFEIDTFLMSCRVLGRTVETAFLSFITDVAKKEGAKMLLGIFIPTKKNKPASDFYKLHGFEILEQSEEQTKWIFNLENQTIKFPEWFKLETNYE